jgi:predicted nucleic-acid-binding Zn-ribbon protein
MSDTGPPSPEGLKAKLDEITGILRERGVPATCPRCGRNEWHADLMGYLASPLPVDGMTVPPPHVPMLNLTCKHCGGTQMHNLNVLGVRL